MIHHGDLFDVLPTLLEASVDACATDPPYGIGFMGKKWDTFKPGETDKRLNLNTGAMSENPNLKNRVRSPATSPASVEYDRSLEGQRDFQVWTERWAREVYRVLKPGAHMLVCGAPRSHHRMASGLEDAGFEIRDCFAWLFGSGFPKSLNVGDGRGTALKPAHEPIVVARKPFKGSLAGNLERHGTGALNIDACRIEGVGWERRDGESGEHDAPALRPDRNRVAGQARSSELGRWPANVLLDEEAAAMLDNAAPFTGAAGAKDSRGQTHGFADGRTSVRDDVWGDPIDARAGASRFYYVAKPSRSERDQGCFDLPGRSAFETVNRDPGSAGANNPRAGAGRTSVLDTREIVYNDPQWVDAVLSRRLLGDTDQSRRKATEGSTIQCSDGSAWSTCWCGSPSTDPYHPTIRSIIETETSSITESRISNSSARPHTNGCMAAAFGVTAAGGNLAAYAEFQSPWRRLTGTSRKKGGHSTADVNLATSIASWLTSVPENGGGLRVEARRNFHPT